jgi:hypothetical protein
MPLFYFDLTGSHEAPDDEGEELPHTEAALLHAYGIARDLSRNSDLTAVTTDSILIMNEGGVLVDRVTLFEAAQLEGRSINPGTGPLKEDRPRSGSMKLMRVRRRLPRDP